MSKRLTWSDLVAAEPALAHLERDVLRHRDDPDVDFCANQVWYGYGGRPSLKRQLCQLVGWGRRPARADDAAGIGQDLLWGTEAYDVAYHHLYGLLPDCRGDYACGVMPRAALGT